MWSWHSGRRRRSTTAATQLTERTFDPSHHLTTQPTVAALETGDFCFEDPTPSFGFTECRLSTFSGVHCTEKIEAQLGVITLRRSK
jgi:hypothetical protein